MNSPAKSLLKFQIGPVQDFIAQARSTRDLWSGSYLLSWLVAKGICKLRDEGGSLIFPNDAGRCQPLLELPESAKVTDHKNLLTPNLPNIFIAKVEVAKPKCVAKAVEKAIKEEWRKIAQSVWEERRHFGLPDSAKDRFDAQVTRHLSISWMITSLPDESPASYLAAYQHNGWYLDAVRQTRDFQAWDSANGMSAEKDSLSGKEEALVGGRDFQEARAKQGGDYAKLFKHADHLGAVAIIKRVWHLAYLGKEQKLKTASDEFRIRSIPAIAARQSKHDDDEDAQEKTSGEKYIAAIAFDGDSIGRWVNGDFLSDKTALKKHHSDFSKALSNFALGEVRKIVEGTPEEQEKGLWKGQLIYAGGDDVVCLVPADAALEVADKLRKAFRECTKNTATAGDTPDASAGIAIGHIHAPLQDLIREAQKAEKRAKNEGPRPAFSVTLMKRSGEISHWTAQWPKNDDHTIPSGLPLYQQIAELMTAKKLTGRFPHRVCQLLTPYLTATTDLSRQQDAITDLGTLHALVKREFAHAAERQGSKEVARELEPLLASYLSTVGGDPQHIFTSVITLCSTVAFAQQNAPDSSPAEKQPAAV